ncbi:hypothetical protein C8Q79DRAFT_582841 [Trametes meyenii]|nr:hypothetical protein C8Q79DRAFT_582841 [Trametes meyenii]
MWLLNTLTYELKKFPLRKERPYYAILSHCWDEDPEREVTFADMQDLSKARAKPGWAKIEGACAAARRYTCKDRKNGGRSPFEWLWDDTCCIDKTSSAEHSEAINSMFMWYRDAKLCLTYLGDVPSADKPRAHNSSFRKSRWFTRGWTLQELVASNADMVFLTSDWTEIGTCRDLAELLESITGIPQMLLASPHPHRLYLVYQTSVAKRMSWAAGRKTSRREDRAYSLLGIFAVNMPVIYGEGGSKAFRRLQLEIIRQSRDYTIFAWGRRAPLWPSQPLLVSFPGAHGLLADSPDYFRYSWDVSCCPLPDFITPLGLSAITEPQFSDTNCGIRLQLPLRQFNDGYAATVCAVLGARSDVPGAPWLALPIRRDRWDPTTAKYRCVEEPDYRILEIPSSVVFDNSGVLFSGWWELWTIHIESI